MATSERELIAFFGDLSKSIDIPTFDQILQMDDDSEREFSRTLVFEFLEQAEDTFKNLQDSLDSKDLHDLSAKGHYLKGSSATLGLIKIRDHCELIQRYGLHENLDGSEEPNDDVCLKRIKEALKALRVDFAEIDRALKRFYKVAEDEDDKDDKSDGHASAEEDEDTDDTEPGEDTKDTKDTKKPQEVKSAADEAKETPKANGDKPASEMKKETDAA